MFGNTSFGSNLFGNTSFGGFPSTPAQPAAPVGTTIRFVPLAGTDSVQKTGSGGASQQSQVSTRHQNICAMKEYETKSAEELRLEDYQAGRKVGQPQTNTLGSSPFGSGMFGMSKPATTTASSPFNVGSPFGANTSTATNQTSFSMFNKPAEPQPNSLFGTQPSTSSQPSSFSIFGNQPNQTQDQTQSVFGQQNTSSLFNNTMNKPATTTANSPFTSATPFGATNTSMLNKPALGQSLFGSNQTTTQQQGSIFGNPTTIAPFGANTSTASNPSNFSIFNKPAEPQNSSPFGVQTSTSTPFGNSIFGANKPATTTANSTFNFGNTFGANTSTANNQTSFSMFNKPAEPQPNSLFGTQPSTSSQPSSFSIFGNQPNQTQDQTQSVFGQQNTSSLFNNTMNKPATTTANSPFTSATPFGATNTSLPNKPALGQSLFGSNQTTTQQQGSIFGNPTTIAPFGANTSTASNPSNFSIFNKPAEPQNSSLFGVQTSTSTPFGNSLFGANKPATTTANSTFNLSTSLATNNLNPGSPLGLSLWQQTILSSPPAKVNNHYKMNAKTTLKLNKPPAPKPMTNLVLFDELDEHDSDELRCAIDVFVPKKTIKKLDLGSPHDSNDNSSRSASPLDTSIGSIVISTRPEYKLKPSLVEIEQHYNSEDDTCIIDSLLIERPDYGSIHFEGPMDVKGLNIDEIVHIRRKEVVVYPNDENKPPTGRGLNRPATVTLHQVWPFDKSTKQIISDVNRLQLMRYQEKVEATTIAEGAKFLEYRPETGSWVFAVEHFSKYSILDDYDEGPPKEPKGDMETTSPPKLIQPNPLFEDFETDTMQTTSVSYVPRNTTKRLPLSNVSLNLSAAVAPTEQQKINQLNLRPDLYAAKNKLINDISSICISGSPKVRFFNGSRKLCYVKGDNVVVNDLQLVQADESLAEHLGNLLQNSTIISMDTQEPIFAPYIETKDYITSASSYDLLRALYGIDLGSKTPYARQDERLNRAINWLASMNQKLSPPPDDDLYGKIIHLMSCNKYDQASLLALESNHPRLAMLVSTLNLNKDIIYEQLCSWRASNADQFIKPKLLRIYVLLAGLTEWRRSDDMLVQSLGGLEWTQQLSLLATHATFSTQPDNLLPFWIKRLETTTNDVDYHIIAKHSPQQILSAAESLSDEWFLLESLKSFKVIDSEVDCAHCDVIHCNLASQLVSIDLRWACFVALHITDNDVRKQILVRCLEQNVTQLQPCEVWLKESLKIPSELIELAKHRCK